MEQRGAAKPSLFAANGEMASLMREFDWRSTPLGEPETWPQSLRSALSICLNALSPIAIFWGPEHTLLYNDAYAAILGERHPWALGKPALQIPEIQELIGDRLGRVTVAGETISFESVLLPESRGGSVTFSVSPILGESEAIAGLFNIVTGTGGQAGPEDRAALSNRQEDGPSAGVVHNTPADCRPHDFQTVVDFALSRVRESVFLIDRGGRFLYVNFEATRSLGYTQDELLTMGVPDIDPDFPPERWATHWSEASEGKSRTFETRHKTKDGRIIPMEVNANYFIYNGCLYSMSLARDISERKEIEAERQRSDGQCAMLEYALNQVREGAYLIDCEGRFVYVNSEACRALGYSQEELLSMRVADIDPNYPQALWPEVWEELLSKGHKTLETLHRTKDGSIFPVEISASLFDYGGQLYSMALSRDITDRKAAEENKTLLIREVNHRAKNLLAVVQAIARQAAREDEPQAFAGRLSDRIAALAASHDLLARSEWRGVEVAKLAVSQLFPYADLIGTRIILDGPPLLLEAAAAQALGMALHELAVNCGKHGALSREAGTLRLEWTVTGATSESVFKMRWAEQGGPAPKQPERQGFGQLIMVEMAQHALEGQVTLTYPSSGLVWELEAKACRVVAMGESRPYDLGFNGV